MTAKRQPVATYRLQFNPGFGFMEARSLLPYLKDLGISEIYASPLFRARKGSIHGYSVTNPLQFSPDLGSKASFDHLARKLQTHNMGLLLDFVPNHMAISPSNPWWMDVLENGPGSVYAPFFDIDWNPPKRTLKKRVFLPILGKPFGQTLEDRDLVLTLEESGFRLRYHDQQFPVAPETYDLIFGYRLDTLEKELGEDHSALLALRGLIALVQQLPPRTLTSSRKFRERIRQISEVQKRLWLLCQGSPEIAHFLKTNVHLINGKKGDSASFEILDTLLSRQAYRLADWHMGSEISNFRRFFSITELIGIRQEDLRVFEATHNLLFRLAAEEKISALRIDHIDGLHDPLGYLLRLQERLGPKEPKGEPRSEFPLLVEKILAADQPMPDDWPVQGTTGYEFINMTTGVLVDHQGWRRLLEIYRQATGITADFKTIVYENKKLIMASLFGGEIESLAIELDALAEQDRHGQDISHRDLEQSLMEVTACLPVYRTYIRDFGVGPFDRSYLQEAAEEARQRNPSPGMLAYDFLRRVLLLQFQGNFSEEKKKSWLKFVLRWQQYTGAITAKGLEDTSLYVFNCLTSLNEVGSSTCTPFTVDHYHRFNHLELKSWPRSLNASSTHDTKRSEDVRARINVLSEIPEEWEQALNRWQQLNGDKKVEVHGRLVPDANEEILLYQTLLGAWPLDDHEFPAFRTRIRDYVLKAAREAKMNTRWIEPNTEYEKALQEFAMAVTEPGSANKFLQDLKGFQKKIAFHGALNSLSMTLLKMVCPGIPDFYWGTEIWDFSLVDPDNRRPVDFTKRVNLLKELKKKEKKGAAALAQRLLSRWQDGAIKLYIIYRALKFRETNPELFLEGDYLPLAASGDRKRHIIGLARRREGDWVVAAVPRLTSHISAVDHPPVREEAWGQERLVLPPEVPEAWTNVLTGESLTCGRHQDKPVLALAEVFRTLPVALLHGSQS